MFLPTKIVHAYQRVPYVTYTLLGLNTVIFVLTWSRLEDGLDHVALNPQNFAPHQLITHLFLHGGLFHLLGNMLFLWVYGHYVEERLGPLRYAGAYLLFGVVAATLYCAFNDGLAVGASGAIAGLMGFVLIGAPWAEVRVLFVLYLFFRPFEIAAFWMVGLWIAFQVLDASFASPWSRIAYSAHFGGFLAGCGLAALLRSQVCEGTSWWLDPAPPGGGKRATQRLRHARRAGHLSRQGITEQADCVVVIESLDDAPSEVAVIKLLMKSRGADPDEAKACLDAVRSGEPQRLAFADAESAARFAEEASALGVAVESV